MLDWIKKCWESIRPDPYEAIASNMRLEGYTDMEIEIEIQAMKLSDAKQNGSAR